MIGQTRSLLKAEASPAQIIAFGALTLTLPVLLLSLIIAVKATETLEKKHG